MAIWKTSNPSPNEIGPIGTDNVVYDDLQVADAAVRVPTANAPTWRLYDMGVASGVTFGVLGFDVGDLVYFSAQTSHSMKLNTVLDLHLHYILPDNAGIGDKFQFQLDVVASGIGSDFTVPTGSPFTAEHTIVDGEDSAHGYLDIADIPAINDTVSSIYKFKLTRIAASADEYAGEVYVLFVDCHYQKDSMGSLKEDSKS
jgi:hypothetical protein